MAYTEEEMAHYERLSNDYIPDAQVFNFGPQSSSFPSNPVARDLSSVQGNRVRK